MSTTKLSVTATPGKYLSFDGPAGPGETTALSAMGTPGRIHTFLPKTASGADALLADNLQSTTEVTPTTITAQVHVLFPDRGGVESRSQVTRPRIRGVHDWTEGGDCPGGVWAEAANCPDTSWDQVAYSPGTVWAAVANGDSAVWAAAGACPGNTWTPYGCVPLPRRAIQAVSEVSIPTLGVPPDNDDCDFYFPPLSIEPTVE